MSAAILHDQCPKCYGQRIAGHTSIGLAPACGHCGGTGRVDSPAALARIAALEAEVALMRPALEWMASYGRSCLDSAKTLHYDMNGRAKHVLDQVAELRKIAAGGEGEG